MHGNRVLLLTENTTSGGINTYAVLIAEGLRARGVPVEIASVWPKPEDWLQLHCQQKGLALTVLAARRSMIEWPAAINRLEHLIRERRFVIVHSQGHYSNLISRAAYLLSGRRACLVSTVHSTGDDPRLGLRLFYWLDWRTFGWNHGTIANSRHTARRLKELGVKTRNLAVILHGVVGRVEADRLSTAPPGQGLRSQRQPVIGFVGRLSWEKGCAVLIEAARILKARGRPFELLIVGDGPERASLECQVAACGLNSQVTFEGWQTETAPYYQRADTIAVPSLTEGLGLVILEAMLHERPVVASRVGGVPEIVSNDCTGILVDPGQPARLAEALERYLTDRELRIRLGRAGRRYVLGNHTIEGMIDQTLAVYRRALHSAEKA